MNRIIRLKWIGLIFGIFLLSCGGETYKYMNFENGGKDFYVPGFGDHYNYHIVFTETKRPGGPYATAEGLTGATFRIDFRAQNTARDVNLSLPRLSPIVFTNLDTGQVFETENEIRGNGTNRIYSTSYPDLPLGNYRIEFSARFCADGQCKDFSSEFTDRLVEDSRFYSNY